jgi:Holliday junction resolvase-like predicted endonuclease
MPGPDVPRKRVRAWSAPCCTRVFHDVHWTHFGEIDFIVLNRAGAVLFIEQKNGTLEAHPGSGMKLAGGPPQLLKSTWTSSS